MDRYEDRAKHYTDKYDPEDVFWLKVEEAQHEIEELQLYMKSISDPNFNGNGTGTDIEMSSSKKRKLLESDSETNENDSNIGCSINFDEKTNDDDIMSDISKKK